MPHTTKLEDFVRDLLDLTIADPITGETVGYRLRQKFHDDPFLEMNSHGLSSWEQALLFTMDRGFIIANTNGLKDVIDSYKMGSDWPPQGMDWKEKLDDDDPCGFVKSLQWKAVPPPPYFTGGTVPFGALSTGSAGPGGWSDPGPHGRAFRPESASMGDLGVSLVLVGEGYLGRGEVIFQKQNIGFVKSVLVSHMHAANFRRIYLKTYPFDVTAAEGWQVGKYDVLVRNEAALPFWIESNIEFEVT